MKKKNKETRKFLSSLSERVGWIQTVAKPGKLISGIHWKFFPYNHQYQIETVRNYVSTKTN